jgi:GNAT superfamily N-acetyltransferase
MRPDERDAVLELAYAVFDEAVAPGFSPRGIVEFRRAARSFVLDAPDGHVVHVAVDDECVVGMIDIRDASHICLFFVDPATQGRGVGRGLFSAASAKAGVSGSDSCTITVNSAPSAVDVYERLGFVATAPEQERDGIRYVAMRWTAG